MEVAVEVRVLTIKARVAELTGNMESQEAITVQQINNFLRIITNERQGGRRSGCR